MQKYLFLAKYNQVGTEGLLKEGGSSRREAVKKGTESVGGRLESFYFAFGDVDALGVLEAPDAASAAAQSLIVNASGTVSVKLTPLMSPETLDEAVKKHPMYRAPGR